MKKEYLQPEVRVKLLALEQNLLIASADVYDDEVDKYARNEKDPAWEEFVNS